MESFVWKEESDAFSSHENSKCAGIFVGDMIGATHVEADTIDAEDDVGFVTDGAEEVEEDTTDGLMMQVGVP